VFTVGNGYFQEGPSPAGRLVDLQVPPLHNQSGSTVRLSSVQLVDPPAGVRLVSVTAYPFQQVGVGVTLGAWGDLPKLCPKEYIPYPVTAAVTAARSDSDWIVMLAVDVPKLGRYHFGRVRIDYIANGKPGWQYQNLDIIIDMMPPTATWPDKDPC